MALVLGTNVGFVTSAPVADPGGSDEIIDGASVVVKHTTPAGAVRITSIGWYRGSGTNTANFEIALYAANGSGGIAGTRLYVDASNSSSSAGWITVAVDWAVDPETDYWLAVQMDSHTGSSYIDKATSGGAGIDRQTTQTTLNNPYGGGTVSDADGMYAIYGLVEVDLNDPPSVELGTPNDEATGQSTTPTLSFTGSDPDSDDLEYEVQVDLNASFDSQYDAYLDDYVPLIDLFSEVEGDFGFSEGHPFGSDVEVSLDLKFRAGRISIASSNDTGGWQTPSAAKISLPFNCNLLAISVALCKDGSPASDTLDLALYEHVSDSNAGALLAQTGASAVSIPASPNPSWFEKALSYALAAGDYFLAWITQGDDEIYERNDLTFPQPAVFDTGVNSSFQNPFYEGASGSNKGYSIFAVCTLPFSTTFYWRVRAKDPEGSNEWGEWSATRSFTTASESVPRRRNFPIWL